MNFILIQELMYKLDHTLNTCHPKIYLLIPLFIILNVQKREKGEKKRGRG